MLRVYAGSDIGKVRSHNEDNFLIGPRNTFIVADGMGGHAAGEIASGILVDVMKRELPRTAVIMDQLGFEYVGTRKKYYEDNGEDAFLFCCQHMPEPDPDFEEDETVTEA